jgi:hypothetical protein
LAIARHLVVLQDVCDEEPSGGASVPVCDAVLARVGGGGAGGGHAAVVGQAEVRAARHRAAAPRSRRVV